MDCEGVRDDCWMEVGVEVMVEYGGRERWRCKIRSWHVALLNESFHRSNGRFSYVLYQADQFRSNGASRSRFQLKVHCKGIWKMRRTFKLKS